MRKRRGWANLFLSLFCILLTLLICEFIYRNLFRERQIISTVNTYYKMDSLVGYRFDPGTIKAVEYFEKGDTIYNTSYTILADTNSYGTTYPIRKAYKNDTAQQETVFLGCSLTFGEGLADEETLPYQYGKLTGTSTVNRACNGMGVHQVYQLFKSEYANQDNSHRVFVYPYFSEHFFRALCLYTWNVAGPWYVLSGDTLLNKGPFYKIKSVYGHRLIQAMSFLGAFTCIKDNMERIAETKAKKKVTEEDLSPYYLMLQQMAAIIQRTGGKFVLLNWDDGVSKTGSKVLDNNIATNKVRQVVSPAGATVLPVWSVIKRSQAEYFIPNDGHPTALANQVLAEYLKNNMKPEN